MQAPKDIAKLGRTWERRIHEANQYWERIVMQTGHAREMANSGQMSQEDWSVHYNTYRFHEQKMGDLVDQYNAFYERWPDLRPVPGQELEIDEDDGFVLDGRKKLIIGVVGVLAIVLALVMLVIAFKPLFTSGHKAVTTATNKVTQVTSPKTLNAHFLSTNTVATVSTLQSTPAALGSVLTSFGTAAGAPVKDGSQYRLTFTDKSEDTIYVIRLDSSGNAKLAFTQVVKAKGMGAVKEYQNADDAATGQYGAALRKGSSVIILECKGTCVPEHGKAMLKEIDRQLSTEAKIQSQVSDV